MAFVLDASLTVVWGLEDEDEVIADATLQLLETEPAHVPAIWWFEVRNVLLNNERRRRISEHDTSTFLKALSVMNIETDRTPSDRDILALARLHRLTVYDASYLELAVRLAFPLATLDRQLAAAARREGVPLIGL
jgi:predicted nucleic acid-binding protein